MAKERIRKLVASEWVTLDGVFDADSMETWFNPYETEERGELIKAGIDAADDLLLGRTTYEMLAGYWPKLKNNEMGIADRLNSMPKHVVSATLKKAEWQSSQIIANNVAENVLELKRRAGQDILIFGSATLVHSLIKANLVDELRFLVHPVIMGNGKRFFRESMPTTKLKPIKTKPMSAGVTALWYTVG